MKITDILLSIGFLLGFVACQTATPETSVTAAVNEEFSLAPGQSAAVKGTDLILTFDSVLSDERCPSVVECAASGPVTVSLSVRQGNGTPIDFTLQTFTDQNGRSPNVQFEGVTNRAEVGDYLIRVARVTPYPKDLSPEIGPSEYRVTLLVSRK
jgi:hypothetical protein